MLDSLKERFATLETLEGTTYLAIGGGLILAQILGLVQFIAALAPVAGIVLIGAGAYKTFKK